MKRSELFQCRLCGSSRTSLVYRHRRRKKTGPSSYAISESHLDKPARIVRCVACALVFAVPEQHADDLRRDYAEMEDPDYAAEETGRRAQARLVLAKIAPFKKRGRMLDIGCGPGFFLDEAQKAGWEAQGAELSRWSAQFAREKFGIDVFNGTPEEAKFPDHTFDAVVMNDVIEHLTDPKRMLAEIRRILKNDGVLYVSTPDIESFWSRVLRAKWWGINKYHLFYFSRRTLERLFSNTGFRSARHTSYPRVFSLAYWLKRLEAYPRWLSWPFRFWAAYGDPEKKMLRIDLLDQIGVIAKKIRRLETIEQDERVPYVAGSGKKKIAVVLPAYNAEKTLERTLADIPRDLVDDVILVDDKSRDGTVELAKKLGLAVFAHDRNKGYGGNQKTCYDRALERGADVVVMCHPDYQYDPRTIPQLVEPIVQGTADAVFGSRMMKGGALEGGMPLWKHNANILLTAFENVMLGMYLTEFHSGFRAYSARLLKSVNYRANSDGFVFDTEIIMQAHFLNFRIEEIPIRTRYFEEASSIKLWPSLMYGLGIVRAMLEYGLAEKGWFVSKKLKSYSGLPR